MAIDSEEVVETAVCTSANIATPIAVKASYFTFNRKDGFDCARRALKSLETSISTNPEARLGSSRLLWGIFSLARDDATRDAEFKALTTSIRLADKHPLRGEARLAQLRLDALRGKPNASLGTQIEGVITDLGIRSDVRRLAALYNDGSLPLRESLRWLFYSYAETRSRASSPNVNLTLRLREIAAWGVELASIGAACPEMARYLISRSWQQGRRLVNQGTGKPLVSGEPYAEMDGKLTYSLCANSNCQTQNLSFVKISDQLIEKRESHELSDSLAAIRYSVDSSPILQINCSRNETSCKDLSPQEAGRHYQIGVVSAVVGGSRWKDAFWKQVKGIEDFGSSVSYSLESRVKIPSCANPVQCPINILAAARYLSNGEDAGTERTATLLRPDGSKTLFPKESLVSIDRSTGDHYIDLKISETRQSKGGTHGPNQESLVGVSLWSGATVSAHVLESTKKALAASPLPLTDYLPVILMTRAVLESPSVTSGTPKYMGLGEALSQYSDPKVANRWERIYLPLYFTSLLQTDVGPRLAPEDRQGLMLADQLLSQVAKDNFGPFVDQQIALLRGLRQALSVALLDSAIGAIQKDQPLDNTLTPFVQTILDAPTTNGLSSDDSLAQAQSLITRARASDNLLDAVLLLYQARDRLAQAEERLVIVLDQLVVEKTGLIAP
ncbi:hypothetical protein [Paraburkholderia sp. RAU2J]|uniref:hypothetical protein n=1 Tax=Paraburkholderia sp. RAU2J TaxID=1938810 RepID=UPI0011C37104|nr:hypothetical protein [Paraburkholderia sp. RAU2J]